MVIAHGFGSILGVGAETTLGTPVAATEKICFISETLSAIFNEVLNNALCGTAVRGEGQQGTLIAEGGIVFPWTDTIGNLFVEYFFGTLAVDTPSLGRQTYSLDANIDGDGLTVAIDKTVSVYESAGYKTNVFTITGNPTDGIRISVDGFFVDLDLESVINTPATLAALGEGGNILLFQDMTFRVADLADALQASDAFDISDFSLEINRNLTPVEVNSRQRTEALENGFRETTLTFTIPQYQVDFFVDAHNAHTLLQFDMLIDTGANSKTIQAPLCRVIDYTASVSGPEFITHEVTIQLYPDPGGVNTFMTLQDINTELEIIED